MRKAPLIVACSLALAAALPATAQTAGEKHGFRGHHGSHHGRGHHHGGHHWRGHHRHHWGHHHYRSHLGYWGVPLAIGIGFGSYWGYPYYRSYWDSPVYYSSPRVIYRDYEDYGYSRSSEPVPTTEIPPAAAGSPTQRPLYQNYCEDSKAYFPKVTTCASGWVMRAPNYR